MLTLVSSPLCVAKILAKKLSIKQSETRECIKVSSANCQQASILYCEEEKKSYSRSSTADMIYGTTISCWEVLLSILTCANFSLVLYELLLVADCLELSYISFRSHTKYKIFNKKKEWWYWLAPCTTAFHRWNILFMLVKCEISLNNGMINFPSAVKKLTETTGYNIKVALYNVFISTIHFCFLFPSWQVGSMEHRTFWLAKFLGFPLKVSHYYDFYFLHIQNKKS